MQNTWYGFWTYWNLYHKVTFDGTNKLILINFGETEIDVRTDIYSAWKEWAEVDDNLKFLQALRAVGGDPTVGSSFLGATFFLVNGWRIRTWEGDQELTINGNLFVDGGGNPFTNTLEPHNVLISTQRSNLVDLLVVSGSGGSSTGSFTETDRETLENINTIVSALPSSASMQSMVTSTEQIWSASYLGSGYILQGGTNSLSTSLYAPTNYYKNMFAMVTSGGYTISRKVTRQYANGVFVFDIDLPFTAVSGNHMMIVPGYNPVNGSIR